MIQPLRVAHRRAFVGLAVVLPAILLIGLGARSSRPAEGALIADVPATANVVRESSNLWQNHTIHSTFYSRSDRPQEDRCSAAIGRGPERARLVALLGRPTHHRGTFCLERRD